MPDFNHFESSDLPELDSNTHILHWTDISLTTHKPEGEMLNYSIWQNPEAVWIDILCVWIYVWLFLCLISFLFVLPQCLLRLTALNFFKEQLFHASQVVQVVKNPPTNAGDVRDMHSILGSVRSPREGNGNTLQYSCLENPMDGGAWWAPVLGITKSQIRLKRLSTHMHILTLYLILPNIHLTVHRTFSTFSQTLPSSFWILP